MIIQDKITQLIERSLKTLGVPQGMVAINLDHPTDSKNGDYSTNVAMLLIKHMGAVAKKPLDLAEILAKSMQDEIKGLKEFPVSKITVAAPGFINFYLTDSFFQEANAEILKTTAWYGKNNKLWNQKIVIDYTDPNPFKPFHIGHLMSNAIGEALSRMLEFQDAKMSRLNYGGDVGLHVAKALWGMQHISSELTDSSSIEEQIKFVGDAYVAGANAYEDEPKAQEEIKVINKKVYDKSDAELNKLYEWGKKVSIEHFKDIYKVLGSKFDYQIFESEVIADGLAISQDALKKGVFELSEGAIIFPGEKFGLHNRVFINSQGLPTYEAKELGLTKKKFEFDDFTQSIVITANEQSDYFKVILKSFEQLFPTIANRSKHVGHGMMRFSSGKMSSRKGNVVTGESLLSDVQDMVLQKMADQAFSDADKKEIAEKVAVGAIKYSILKQTTGKDIIFDPEKSISFEGDSGPYLQYAYVRTRSLLAKGKTAGIQPNIDARKPGRSLNAIEKMLYQFPEIVERAAQDFAPNYIATYLIQVAGEFNAYYANTKIIDEKDAESAYRLALTEAVGWVLKNGLWVLGIETPEKM